MRLRRVHERIARGFEQVRPVALFEIAEHFDQAGLAERAFEYALLAAARAVSVQAYADASAAYERARAHAATPAQRARLDELVCRASGSVAECGRGLERARTRNRYTFTSIFTRFGIPAPCMLPLAVKVGAVREQNPLHVVRPADELPPLREERRDEPGHVRRRHARAAHLRVELLEQSPRRARCASFRTEKMRSPGATQSGFIRPSAVGPRDEKNDVP